MDERSGTVLVIEDEWSSDELELYRNATGKLCLASACCGCRGVEMTEDRARYLIAGLTKELGLA